MQKVMFVVRKQHDSLAKIVTMINKYRDEVSKIVKKYFKYQYNDSLNVFDDISQRLEGIELSAKESSELKKLMRIFFLGQLTGLRSLNAILLRFNITSNNEQIKYKILCNRLTNSNLHQMFEFAFEQEVMSALSFFSDRHTCKWSRDIVTAVLDDSVFKQWLKNQDVQNAYENCYGRFFSGQVGHVVYGFQVVTFGLVIEEVFYPLYFESVKKADVKLNEKGKKIPPKRKSTIEVAEKLVEKWGLFVKKMRILGLKIHTIYFSCDSGYSDVLFSGVCLKSGLIYISVPKMSHLIVYENNEISLKNWIEKIYIPLENEHEMSEKYLKKEEKIPFCYRFRAFYKSQNREVTWLAFRLDGSNKVTLIYTTDKNIKGVTLRRHWFQRTYIEQFFKILKHYMNIQASITISKHDFEVKLLRFAFMALHIQLLVKTMKKKLKKKLVNCKDKGFGFIRMFMQSDLEALDLLHQIIILNN